MSKRRWIDRLVSGAKTMAIILVALVLAVSTAMCVNVGAERQARPCKEMGGHYVPATIGSPEECWSLDGTRRLFPKG